MSVEGKAKPVSMFTGTTWRGDCNKWSAVLCVDGETTYLGMYEEEVIAAGAYDAAVIERRGPHAMRNFFVDDPDEEWRQLDDWPYQVSDRGRVRRIGGGFLKAPPDRDGYPIAHLKNDGDVRMRRVHVLVAKLFIGPRPTGYAINHIDGDKANNRPENLEYCTHSENLQHSYDTGLRDRRVRRRKIDERDVPRIRERAKAGESYASIARDYPIGEVQVSRIVRRLNWEHIP